MQEDTVPTATSSVTEKAAGRRFNNYTLAIIVAVMVGGACALPLLILHAISFGEMPTWLFELVSALWGLLFTSSIVSGAGYCAKFFDIPLNEMMIWDWLSITNIKKHLGNLHKHINGETLGLWIVIPAALAITLVTLVLHFTVPFAATVGHGLADLILFVANASMLGGMGNRLGRSVDYLISIKNKSWNEWFRQKHINYVLSVLSGLLIGAAVASVFIGLGIATGGVFPLVLFGVGIVSVCMSSSGYVGRVFDFLFDHRAAVPVINDEMAGKSSKTTLAARWKSSEHKGTALGVTAGFILGGVGCALIIAGIATLPLFGVGLPKLLMGILFVAIAVSACGGLGNRLGAAHDKWKDQPVVKEKIQDTTTVTSSHQLTTDLNHTQQEIQKIEEASHQKQYASSKDIVGAQTNHGLFARSSNSSTIPRPTPAVSRNADEDNMPSQRAFGRNYCYLF